MLIRIVIILVLGIVMSVQTTWAQPLPQIDTRYNSFIVDDSEFKSGFDITTGRIQAFLDNKGQDCDGDFCLKDYRDPETDASAAQIIRQNASELGINPLIIIVTLQKENSLVTASGPELWQYRTAMGYGCPDDAPCEELFYGFSNQVRLGSTLLSAGFERACGNQASHLKWWVHPRWQRHSITPVDGRPTYIGNCATASLYNYTPHRVDSAWIATQGTYYYGNYNFVNLFESWKDEI